MPSNIDYERQAQVNDDGRSKRQKRSINEKKPYGGGGNAQFLAQTGANPKSMPLEKVLNSLNPVVYHSYYPFT
ncbi:MAG TPA: hypothetical protein VK517_08430 [Cyclobacteriaceae bacterium]|nr:hypothetical protein [Cyclobacteriaceae bacterium]